MKTLLTTLSCMALSLFSNAQYELDWNAQISGMQHDDSRGMILNSESLYIAGRIESNADFISGTTFSTESSAGLDDICLAKLDINGNFQWVKSMGGLSSEQAVAIDADAQGNIYVIGFFNGSFDFDPGAGISTITATDSTDAFVAKFTSAGDLVWVNQINGTMIQKAEDVTVTSTGVVVTGRYQGVMDADPTGAVVNHSSNGWMDVFVIKYDLNGVYQWSNSYGTSQGDIGWGIDSDASGNIYVSGVYKNTIEFETGNASSLHTSNGMSDLFILKLDANGSYVWSKSIGDVGDDNGKHVTISPSNEIYVMGYFEQTVDFDPGALVTAAAATSGRDAFLLKLNSAGDFQWVNTVGGNIDNDIAKAVDFDADDNIFYVGTYSGTVTLGLNTHVSNGLTDCFVQKLDPSGNSLWSTSFGTTDDDYINAIIVDSDTSLFLDGKFNGSMDIDPSAVNTIATSIGDYDGYIFKWKLENSSIGINELSTTEKYLVKVYDLIGRETEFKANTPLLLLYSDGSVERSFKLDY